MSDMVDLIMLNLEHIEDKGKDGKDTPPTLKGLDFIVDAVLSGGRSLMVDESRWYENSGGVSWNVVSDDETNEYSYSVDEKTPTSSADMFKEQCSFAAADAFSRLVASGRQTAKNPVPLINFGGGTAEGKKFATLNAPKASNSAPVGAEGGTVKWSAQLEDLRDSLASRLAWTLKGTRPRGDLAVTNALVVRAVEDVAEEEEKGKDRAAAMKKMNEDYPLVYSCLARDLLVPNNVANKANASLSTRLLYESYAAGLDAAGLENEEDVSYDAYAATIDGMSASVAHLCKVAQTQQKSGQSHLPSEPTRRFIANSAVSQLSRSISVAPVLTQNSLQNFSKVVNSPEPAIADPKKKSSISERASARAQKASAEKRAKNTLLALRDVCFRRTSEETRRHAVGLAVGIAAGGVPAGPSGADTGERKGFALFNNHRCQKHAQQTLCFFWEYDLFLLITFNKIV